MKLIISRKGFDSASGGVPSPIFPDGRMVSLPIPDKQSLVTYGDIQYKDGSIGPLAVGLTKGRIPSHYRAHIDPDLVKDSLPRQRGWRPIFGQTGPAQSHLRNNEVGPGDLFLFFGLFRKVEKLHGTYTWVRDSRPYHVIWGWLQVAEVLDLGRALPHGYDWAKYHPHFNRGTDPNNVIYIARRHLKIAGLTERLSGAGSFQVFSQKRKLTASGARSVTTWDLPGWFHPGGNRNPLTYHADLRRWQKRGDRTVLKSVARGQEFVLDCDDYPEVIHWACDLIRDEYEC
ncbi:MAG: hypothetical protein WCX84_09135 [Syntrophales bacterium]|jgi:hypothetical protein|nr:hypothetical protein [Syntrophales bacterium]